MLGESQTLKVTAVLFRHLTAAEVHEPVDTLAPCDDTHEGVHRVVLHPISRSGSVESMLQDGERERVAASR